MSKTIKVSDLPRFDMAEWLDDEAAIAEYLTVVIEENDPSVLAEALGTVARARHDSDRGSCGAYTRGALQSTQTGGPAAL